MKPLPPPANPPSTPEQEREATERKQDQIAFAHVFSGMHGERVLKRLRREFGFEADGVELPSAIPGLRSEEVWLREGFKQPVRFISKMLRPADNQPQPKPTTATT